MRGKRTAPDVAPGSPRPPPPPARRRRVAGNDDEHSSPSDHSDMATLGDDDERSFPSSHSEENVGSGDSSEGSEIADMLDNLNIAPSNHDPAEGEELAAAAAQEHSQPQDDQPAEMDVQQPPPANQSDPPAEVADQSVAAAAPAPDMVLPAAESPKCSRCGNEPAVVRLVPVEHACFCDNCRSSGLSYCDFCGVPRR